MTWIILPACLFFSILYTGIVWLLQILHYPLFQQIGPRDFNDYYRGHKRKVSAISLVPAMMASLLSACLVLFPPWELSETWIYTNLGIVLLAWIIHLALVLPNLKILSQHGYSELVIQRLTLLHWLPTLLWTASSFLLIWMIYSLLQLGQV